MIYDYGGLPDHTYHLQYPAPGDPALASQVVGLLKDGGVACDEDPKYGFDHGAFVPLMLMYPEADIPVVTLSIHGSYDGALHFTVGELLQPLRRQGVLIMGSGSASHTTRDPAAVPRWHDYLTDTLCKFPAGERRQRLIEYRSEALCMSAHPQPDHLMPVLVAAGAAGQLPGYKVHTRVAALDLSSFVFSPAPTAVMVRTASRRHAPLPATIAADPIAAAVGWAEAHATRVDPQSVLQALDEFAWTQHWMMFVGDRKGFVLDDAVRHAAQKGGPVSVLEFGAFLGYSAVRIARILLAEGAPGSVLSTVEVDPRHAELAQRVVRLAGFPEGLVRVDQALSSEAVQGLVAQGSRVDVVFLDHHKDLYAQDAQALERGGCLVPGRSVLVAENVICPGCPEYLKWVRGCGWLDSTFHAAELEYTEAGGRWELDGKRKDEAMPDGVEVSRYLGRGAQRPAGAL